MTTMDKVVTPSKILRMMTKLKSMPDSATDPDDPDD